MVKYDGCLSAIAPFSGRLGLYIEGSVSPPIADVDIKILAAGDSQHISLRKGELALQTITGTDGSFVGGPLYDDITYIVEASKVSIWHLFIEPISEFFNKRHFPICYLQLVQLFFVFKISLLSVNILILY